MGFKPRTLGNWCEKLLSCHPPGYTTKTLAAHQLHRFLLAHSGSVVGVHEAVQVGAAGPADGGRLPNDGAADGHGVNLKKSGHVELAQTFMVLRHYAEGRLCRIAEIQ